LEATVRRIRRIEVTVETDEIAIIRGLQDKVLSLCPECAEAIVMITPDQAAVMACTKTREIYRRVEEGSVHVVETPEGFLLVCPRSVCFAGAGLIPSELTKG
jgi:hypothetical protein